VAYHFAAGPLLLLDVSTSQKQHLQLPGAAQAGQKFDKQTYEFKTQIQPQKPERFSNSSQRAPIGRYVREKS
jgi:hypothetical protein